MPSSSYPQLSKFSPSQEIPCVSLRKLLGARDDDDPLIEGGDRERCRRCE